ncbi:MAG: hypothetical protein WC797_01040 [Candidatus Paceibacterota bacterium]|jgi:hypothetical protein
MSKVALSLALKISCYADGQIDVSKLSGAGISKALSDFDSWCTDVHTLMDELASDPSIRLCLDVEEVMNLLTRMHDVFVTNDELAELTIPEVGRLDKIISALNHRMGLAMMRLGSKKIIAETMREVSDPERVLRVVDDEAVGAIEVAVSDLMCIQRPKGD